MPEQIKDNIIIKKECEIIITPQAQMIIASSKYSIEDFTKWSLVDSKISLGGNNVVIFLEKMYKLELEK